ncbi:TetR/AcrR family transcriptional regulator [Streptomyces sp. ISL-1]|uniref:ScbR family autoregulator-binding transcription factor n=1 Tax=Streptomyces sp. ISL-1 TaxID=2817657 RepID=UPI001BE61DD0|nr:ScbR family autoregulator-binding transcription factor [Streptomyces sp. ISL-1]MBT2387996.1 TetR/AcrR family transcriptional regulator [Streptomyces sp. ISL-1]
MTRQLRAEQTRTTIIEAAAEMFDRYGYGSTSLSDIVTQGKVTKGALYFHFASKEGLAHAVMTLQHELSIREAQEVSKKNLPGLESLIRISYGIADQVLRNPVTRAGVRLTLESGSLQQPMRDPYRDWVNVTTEHLERSVDELHVRPGVNVPSAAQFIVSAFTGLQLVTPMLESLDKLPLRIADMWATILPGLVPPRKAAYYLNMSATIADGMMREL